MNIKPPKLLKVIFFLFPLNAISLYLYLSHLAHIQTTKSIEEGSTSGGTNDHAITHGFYSWPKPPSYLPWTENRVAFRSCEGYFGNGFTSKIEVIPRENGSDPAGWFHCFYSETLQSSICEGGKVRLVPDRVKMSRGGEELETVIGREEDDELPEFQNSAFEVLRVGGDGGKVVDDAFLNKFIPHGGIAKHTMRQLIGSMRMVDHDQFTCDQWIEEPTLLVTRFEYANLFHTVTDWYSAYVSSRVTGLSHRPHLIFLDGHCATPLEQVWKALFPSVRYAKHFNGSVCFLHAVLVPLGYETAFFKGLSDRIDCQGVSSALELRQNAKRSERRTARISEFGEIIKAAFNVTVGSVAPASSNNILFIRREDYLAHPRHQGKVQSRLTNEEEVLDSLKRWASSPRLHCRVNIVNGLFGHMPLKDQIRAIQEASVIVAAHGAGLTHIVSANSKAVVLEIISSRFLRPHFQLIARWRGLEYHAINLRGSYVHPHLVIDQLDAIMKNFGC